MLPIEDTESADTKVQWYKYQVKVWNKLQTQMHRAFEEGDLQRWVLCIKIMKLYGEVLSVDYEFEDDRMVHLKDIFEQARDVR